jgi:hypothetical protein
MLKAWVDYAGFEILASGGYEEYCLLGYNAV